MKFIALYSNLREDQQLNNENNQTIRLILNIDLQKFAYKICKQTVCTRIGGAVARSCGVRVHCADAGRWVVARQCLQQGRVIVN